MINKGFEFLVMFNTLTLFKDGYISGEYIMYYDHFRNLQ